jgi:hypothetical protein
MEIHMDTKQLTEKEIQRFEKILKIKECFKCPLTHEIINDPCFVAIDPLTIYDKEAITEWFKEHQVLPTTNEPVSRVSLKVNPLFVKQLKDYKEKKCTQCLEFAAELLQENKALDHVLILLELALKMNEDVERTEERMEILQELIKCLKLLGKQQQETERRLELIALMEKYAKKGHLVHIKEILLSDLKLHLNEEQKKLLFELICKYWDNLIDEICSRTEMNYILSDFAIWIPKNKLGLEKSYLDLLLQKRENIDVKPIITSLELMRYDLQTLISFIECLKEKDLDAEICSRLDSIVINKLCNDDFTNENKTKAAQTGSDYYTWRNKLTNMRLNEFEYGKKLLCRLCELDPMNVEVRKNCIEHALTDESSKEFLMLMTSQIMGLMKENLQLKDQIKEIKSIQNKKTEREERIKEEISSSVQKALSEIQKENKHLKLELEEMKERLEKLQEKKKFKTLKRFIRKGEDDRDV